MELTWLADTPQSRSRTRALRACPACQRRKKRCRHLTASAEPPDEPAQPPRKIRAHAWNGDAGDADRQRSQISGPAPRARTTSEEPALSSFPSTERFVGDLNPEAVIRERLDASAHSPLRDRVGLWINSSALQDDTVKPDRRQTTGSESLSISAPHPILDRQTVTSMLQQRYASAVQSCNELPVSTREKLTAIYIKKIHSIVPLLDIERLKSSHANASSSVFLDRAICLVAAKAPSASPFLRLEEEGPVLSSRQFCSEIYNGLAPAMDAELEPDRVTRIRVLALMSLHCEGHEGAEAASLHLCQAIHQAQTVGLHLDRPGRTSADPLTRLFWCLWTLDKMHASIGGRPVLLADRDIGIAKFDTKVPETRGAFAVWLAISDLLATVISFYRPSAGITSGWEDGFPAFEDIVEANTNGDVDFATLGFLELYYHCVAILSCRYKLTESLDGTRVSSIRQGLAAVRIHSIVAVECGDRLPPHPIVPYAISLSMGVSYRQLRSSKLITHFDRAKASLEACCTLLENLSLSWYSAEAMARLGRKALHQVDHEHHPQPADVPHAPPIVRAGPAEAEPAAFSTNTHDVVPAPRPIEMDSGMPFAAPVPLIGPETSSMANPLPSVHDHDLDAPTHGFADIDTLFGEFLDLSLPTNFWDPVFAEDQNNTSQTGTDSQRPLVPE
ncbi:transcriptional regulator family: Fungal Specific TF [Penicillium argentinense]|uniref:Transcriptional regulator family: Fungal Specific TF n=1 Tax=Penicillium argentinense TaxID=1131581 RepID=A0A9W9FMC8_9EURO|nr:transcriptional regulator family: Fungal Specific TF [Penicillium argentinense]KAJ5102851.1 transcriptional regulator family: Fungal Specific TF [Penicillium argentinense]